MAETLDQIRRDFAAFAARQEDGPVKSRCVIIRQNLRLLARDPTSTPVLRQTAINVADLAKCIAERQ